MSSCFSSCVLRWFFRQMALALGSGCKTWQHHFPAVWRLNVFKQQFSTCKMQVVDCGDGGDAVWIWPPISIQCWLFSLSLTVLVSFLFEHLSLAGTCPLGCYPLAPPAQCHCHTFWDKWSGEGEEWGRDKGSFTTFFFQRTELSEFSHSVIVATYLAEYNLLLMGL